MMGDGSPFWNPAIKADQFCSTRPMAENVSSSPAVELQKPRLPPLPGLLRFKKGLKCEPPRRGCRGGRTRARRGGSRPLLLVSLVADDLLAQPRHPALGPECRRGSRTPRGLIRVVARRPQRRGVCGDGSRDL